MRLLLVLLCASCVQSNEVKCDDGRLCAPGYVCDNANHRCLSPDQVNACDGRDEGADCSFGGAPGACRMGTCEPLVCGDGVRSLGEACDGSDLGTADCTTAGFYYPDGLACSEFCTFDVSGCTGSCGDNTINGDELCDGAPPQGACIDLGFDAGALACATSCGYSFASCGRFGWVPEAIGIASVSGLHGTSASDLWAIGADLSGIGQIAHYDGTTWTSTSTGSTDLLIDVWATSATDAWIVTSPGRPLHWNGTQWSSVAAAPAATYRDVWAASSTAVYFATTTGVTWFDGTNWQPLGALADSIVAIDGSGANDIWIAKSDGTLAHWNGSTWLPVAVDVTVRHLDVVSASSVWVVGPSTATTAAAIAHWSGLTWTTYTDPVVSPDSFGVLVASADNDVWVIGPLARPRHFDGIEWTDSTTGTTSDATVAVVAAHKLGDAVIAAANNGFVLRYRGQMLSRLTPNPTATVTSLWSDGPNRTFVGDLRGNVYRFSGSSWTKYAVDTSLGSFNALFGTSASDVWASGGTGRVYRFNGVSWSLQTTLLSVAAIWASGVNDAWFFGQGITHYDGTFSPVTVAASGFRGASGTGPNDIWAIAPTTTSTDIAHYNGSTWSVTTQPHEMTAIFAVAPNDVFATADDNHILHFDGNTWSDTVVPVSTQLDHIWASAPDDVMATSLSQAVHFDGTTWSPVRMPSENLSTIRAVTVAPGYIDVLIGGSSQQLVRRLIRTRFWSCRASETDCGDGVDDDCDGNVDVLDTDC
jgi:hypothetical protein